MVEGPRISSVVRNQWPRADGFLLSEITEAEVVKSPGAITHALVNTAL